MCGIAGVLNGDGDRIDLATLHRMAERLVHRGPDGAGFLVDDPGRRAHALVQLGDGVRDGARDDEHGSVGLAHRRLSIIDVAGGAQPIANEDETCFIVYNGEIYNHRELRRELEAAGHRFRTHADSEVILHLYEEEGAAGVARLDGIFAFAIWDRARRRMFLARDRLGVKPLYIARRGDRLAFASEVKALLALPWIRADVDARALVEHFTFQNMFGDRTLFRDVELLAPAHTMTVELDEGRLRTTTEQYWELVYEEDADRDMADWADELRETFVDVVTAQLMSEVPVGAFLSGGMDTGALSATAARTIHPLHTFTCGFDLSDGVDEDHERLFDERDAARALSGVLGTVHHEMVVQPGDLVDVLPALVWHMDEPRVGISYQNYLVNALVKRDVTVVLSGVGGDELFGGYPWRYRAVRGFAPDEFVDGYYKLWQRMVPDDERTTFFSRSVQRELGDSTPRESVAEVLAAAPADDPVHRAMWFDTKTFLHGLLVVEDKLSMAHSVESRVPLCGNRLLELVRRMPSKLKVSDDDTKIVLKEAFRGLVPDATLTQPKVGFTPPDATWYRRGMAPFVEGLLLDDRSLARGWFRPEAVRRVVDEHQSGLRNHRFLLWSLMCFEWWNRIFLDGDGSRSTLEPTTLDTVPAIPATPR